jgi:hypothetical protein
MLVENAIRIFDKNSTLSFKANFNISVRKISQDGQFKAIIRSGHLMNAIMMLCC